MSELAFSQILRFADLPNRKATQFSLVPDAQTRAAIAQELEILGVKKMSFTGRLTPKNSTDWQLEAKLGATVVQSCVVTLEPVTTRIDTTVTRQYLSELNFPQTGEDASSEMEMPQDDTIEPLGAVIDLGQIAIEALALALPDYPRAPGADLEQTAFAAKGVEPLRDSDLKPFAGLAQLRKKLDQGKED